MKMQRRKHEGERCCKLQVNKHIDDDYNLIIVAYLEYSSIGDGSH